MEDFPDEKRAEVQGQDRPPAGARSSLIIACVVLFGAAIFAGAYAVKQSAAVADLDKQNRDLYTAEAQQRSQIDALNEKVAKMSVPPPAPATAPTSSDSASASGVGKSPSGRSASASGSARPDRRMQQMQSQLARQQKELKQTQNELASARSDLEGEIGSTRTELTGSIATTHDELVALEKRGQRLYYEFDLSKSKDFHREGPIQVSLRKSDAKHQSYDLMMLVDDHELSKKKVVLYEPIWLHDSDAPEPVQVVVNKIDKDHIHGYVSAPRYRESELASNAAAQQSTAPGSASGSTTTSSSPASNSSSTSSISATTSRGQQQPVN
jgi:hypothetical protein